MVDDALYIDEEASRVPCCQYLLRQRILKAFLGGCTYLRRLVKTVDIVEVGV